MRTSFGHARAVRSVAENVFVELDLEDAQGIGEGVPRSYVTGESVDFAFECLRATSIRDLDRACAATSFEEAMLEVERLRLHDVHSTADVRAHASSAALECALIDALTRRFRRSFADVIELARHRYDLPRGSGGPPGVSRVLDLSMSVDDFVGQGRAFHHVKVKGDASVQKTVALVESVRSRIPAETTVSVDANMGWSFDDAVTAARSLRALGVDWLEEPIEAGRFDLYRRLRTDGGLAVMLDESVRTYEEAERALDSGACDSVNVRVSKLGGIFPALRMIGLLRPERFQLGVQVGEVGPLRAEVLHLAAAVDGWLACEAGQAHRWFTEPLVDPAPVLDTDAYRAVVPTGDGLGVRFTTAFDRFVTREAVVS
jgi:L-alanine-DL-glutamate epimerase-like enolase superfamily enzyme